MISRGVSNIQLRLVLGLPNFVASDTQTLRNTCNNQGGKKKQYEEGKLEQDKAGGREENIIN